MNYFWFPSSKPMNIISHKPGKTNGLPEVSRKNYAGILRNLLADCKWFSVSPDTIRICLELHRIDQLSLRRLGFFRPKRNDEKRGNSLKRRQPDTFALNIELPNGTKVKIHWSIVPSNKHWISIETSLPRFVYGTNFRGFCSTTEILEAVDTLSRVVSEKLEIEVNLRRGHFSRLDVFVNLSLGSDKNVNRLISCIRYEKIRRRALLKEEWKTTALFRSSGKRLETEIYNKSREARGSGYKDAPGGEARIEVRYLDTKNVRKNAEALGFSADVETVCQINNLQAMFLRHLPPIIHETFSSVITTDLNLLFQQPKATSNPMFIEVPAKSIQEPKKIEQKQNVKPKTNDRNLYLLDSLRSPVGKKNRRKFRQSKNFKTKIFWEETKKNKRMVSV